MYARNAWIFLPDNFRELLEFVYCSHQGEIWLFNNDLLVFENLQMFEELYSDIIDNSPIKKNIRSVKLLLKANVYEKIKDPHSASHTHLCTLSKERLETFYIGKIPDGIITGKDGSNQRILDDVPYIFYTTQGTLQGTRANDGIILVRPADHPFKDTKNRYTITVGWQVQDKTLVTHLVRERFARMFDDWFKDLSLFESVEPIADSNNKIKKLKFISPRTDEEINSIWHGYTNDIPRFTPKTRPIPSQVHYVVITALEEEAFAVTEKLNDLISITIGGRLYQVGYYQTKSGPIYKIAICTSERTGCVASALATNDAINALLPKAVFLLGIAATKRTTTESKSSGNTLKLGDVVYSTHISPYEYTKIKEKMHAQEKTKKQSGKPDITREERTLPCSGFLVTVAQQVARLWEERPPMIKDWPKSSTPPRAAGGTIATGSKLIADTETVKAISEIEEKLNRKLIAIEMEGEGVAEASTKKNTPFIVIKGISDFANSDKNDDWHLSASRASADFFYQMLDILAASKWQDF